MYDIADKKQINNLWVYTIATQSFGIFQLESFTEYSDEELNNLVDQEIFKIECSMDYTELADDILESEVILFDKNGTMLNEEGF